LASRASAGLSNCIFGMGTPSFCASKRTLRERNILNALQELEHVAGLAAAETMKELPRGVYGERRRFLAVERTQPGVILRARALEANVLAYDANNIRLLLERVTQSLQGSPLVNSLPESGGGVRGFLWKACELRA